MLKYLVLLVSTVLSGVTLAVAQSAAQLPAPPGLEYLLTYDADFSFPDDLGESPAGNRIIFPLRQGKFSGPKLNGETRYLMISKGITN
jgi:hypothetical protein